LGVDDLVCAGGVMLWWCMPAGGGARAEFHHPAVAEVHGGASDASREKKTRIGRRYGFLFFLTVRFLVRPK
jgi:hypothetical protein